MKKLGLESVVPLMLSFLLIGLFIGFIQSGSQDSFSPAQETLSRYPVDLSIAGQRMNARFPVEEKERMPSINLTVKQDPMSQNNYNLEMEIQDFKFNTENISEGHIPNHGHAHIRVDGVLIGRAYSRHFHIPRLEEGSHEITAVLSNNVHEFYQYRGELAKDSVRVVTN